MSIFSGIKSIFSKPDLNEELKQFKSDEDKSKDTQTGEGMINPSVQSAGLISQQFNDKFLYQKINNKVKRIQEYRKMNVNGEISDVIEDAAIESTTEDSSGKIFHLDIKDENIIKNENISKNINKEFEEFIYNRLDLRNKVYSYFEDFFVEGELFFENVIDINNKNKGILYWKKLPTETMDFIYDYNSSKIKRFVQYLKNNVSINNVNDLKNNKDVISFYPDQINYMYYGKFNSFDKSKTYGYLEKARKAFNQLQMLETSLIIYRLVRAPERFVFEIDVGNMPKNKALEFVEKMKRKLSVKESFNSDTGELQKDTNIMSLVDNFFLPKCLSLNTKIDLLDGRSLTLSEIIEEYKQGCENFTYSIDQENKEIVPGKIEWAGITRKNAQLIRVYLDNEEYIECTPDHKFVLRDGTEKEAQYLTLEDSLMPLYKKEEDVTNSYKNYEMVYDLNKNEWDFTHKVIAKKPGELKETVIHHVDFDKWNNNPTNLVFMDVKEHIKFHCDHNEKMWERDGFREYMSERKTEWWNNNEDYKKVLSDMKTEWWNNNPHKRDEMSILMKEKWNDENFVLKAKEVQKKPKSDSHKKNLSISVSNFMNSDRGDIWKEEHSKKMNEYYENENKEQKDLRTQKIKNYYENETAEEKLIRIQKQKDYFNSLSDEEKELRSQKQKDWWDSLSDEEKQKNNEVLYNNSQKMKYKFNEKMWDSFLNLYNKNLNISYKKLTSLLGNEEIFMDQFNIINENKSSNTISKNVICMMLKEKGYKNYTDFKANYKYNHKITKIEWLDKKEDTGCLTIEDTQNNHNFALTSGVFVKNSSGGRGSSVSSVGGNSSGFTEMDDIYYFQKKLYKVLKYPISRVQNKQDGNASDNIFGGSSYGEIPRDEVKWSVFLEKHQNAFCDMLKKSFLLHLRFKGIQKQYGLNGNSFNITMTVPNSYKEQINHKIRQQKFENYSMFSNEEEFSKYFLMKKYLEFTEEEIQENIKGLEFDKKYLKLDDGGF